MGDNYNINGAVGAVGPNARAENNNITQTIYNRQDERKINSQEILKLKEFVEQLSIYSSEGISKAEIMLASGHIYSLIEAAESSDENKEIEVLSNCKAYFSKLGEKTKEALGVAANIATVGLPLMKLLGLSTL